MTVDPPRRGRPPRLTPDRIGRAVLEVGFPGLTFAAVRERLGVGESTLFRHAPDRDALVRLGLEHALRRVTWPPLDGPWRDLLTRYAFTAWHAWAAHPGSATEAARGIVPLGVMQLMDDLGVALVRQGFTPQGAVLACDLVFDLVTDNRRGIEHFDALVPSAGPGRDQVEQMWTGGPGGAGARAAGTEREAIHAALAAAVRADPLEWFTGKLGIVLDGIEHTLAP